MERAFASRFFGVQILCGPSPLKAIADSGFAHERFKAKRQNLRRISSIERIQNRCDFLAGRVATRSVPRYCIDFEYCTLSSARTGLHITDALQPTYSVDPATNGPDYPVNLHMMVPTYLPHLISAPNRPELSYGVLVLQITILHTTDPTISNKTVEQIE